jgi:hypothetical protein
MTSIEWLDEKLQNTMYVQYGYINGIRKIVIPLEDYMKFKKEAKEMHYKELMNSMQRGMEIQQKYNSRKGFRERNNLSNDKTNG